MKKLALALVASSFAVVGTASADINTGFYLGAGIGANHTQVKPTIGTAFNFAGVATRYAASSDLGRTNVEGTVYGGYGFVTGCTYLGAELGYTFVNNKVSTDASLTIPVLNASRTASLTFERRNVINAALLVGQKFTPSTMGYIRLGLNSAQYKVSATYPNAAGVATATNESKRKFSFAPGVGLETAVHKNVRVRLQYVYDLGAKIVDQKVKSQSVTLGVAYKF